MVGSIYTACAFRDHPITGSDNIRSVGCSGRDARRWAIVQRVSLVSAKQVQGAQDETIANAKDH